MPKVETTVGFDFTRDLTEMEVAATLDVDAGAARELLAGAFAFEANELKELARVKGVTVEELVRVRTVFDL